MKIIQASIMNVDKDINGVTSHMKDLRLPFLHPYQNSSWRMRLSSCLSRLHRYPGGACCLFFSILLAERELCHRFHQHKNVDVWHVHDVMAAAVALKASRGKIPVFLTCHFWTWPWEEFVKDGWIKKNSFVYKLMKKKFLKTLQDPKLKLIFLSQRNVRLLEKLGRKGTKITCGINLCPTNNDCRGDPRGRPQYRNNNGQGQALPLQISKNNKSLRIVNVGRLDKRKNQRSLIDVALCLRNLGRQDIFVLIGPEDPSEFTFMQARIKKEKLEKYFVFLGSQDRSKTLRIMADSDLMLHMSKNESLGLVLVESVLSGTPVVSLEFEALEEIFPDLPEAVISVDDSPEKIAHRLMILSNPSKRIDLFEKQDNICQKIFNPQKMISELFDLYNQNSGQVFPI